MSESNTCLYDWGRSLIDEFPDGLPAEPDFHRDGEARMSWLARGVSIGLQWASDLGLGGKVYLGKTYDDFEALDDSGKAELAKAAFRLAQTYTGIARIEAEKAKRQEEARRNELASVEARVVGFRLEVAGETSREALRFRLAELNEVAGGSSSMTVRERYETSERLNVVKDRLIEIDMKESRRATSGWWITLVGTLAGVAGLIVGFLAGSAGSG